MNHYHTKGLTCSPKFVSLYQAQTYEYSWNIPINVGFRGFSCMASHGVALSHTVTKLEHSTSQLECDFQYFFRC